MRARLLRDSRRFPEAVAALHQHLAADPDSFLAHYELAVTRFLEGDSYRKALEEDGVQRWRKRVAEAVEELKPAFLADYVVLGGGNSKEIDELPEGCRRGGNQNAYFGGLRMWEDAK